MTTIVSLQMLAMVLVVARVHLILFDKAMFQGKGTEVLSPGEILKILVQISVVLVLMMYIGVTYMEGQYIDAWSVSSMSFIVSAAGLSLVGDSLREVYTDRRKMRFKVGLIFFYAGMASSAYYL